MDDTNSAPDMLGRHEQACAAIEDHYKHAAATKTNIHESTAATGAAILESAAVTKESILKSTDATRRPILVGLVILLISGIATAGVLWWHVDTSSRSVMNELSNLERQVQRGVTIGIAEYQTPPFRSGSAVCVPDEKGHNPCQCVFSTTLPQAGCIPLGSVANSNLDAVVVVSTGGHDVARLTSATQKSVSSNNQLAMTRADTVAAAFGAFLKAARKASDRRQATNISIIPAIRGALYEDRPDNADRTVKLTIVRARSAP